MPGKNQENPNKIRVKIRKNSKKISEKIRKKLGSGYSKILQLAILASKLDFRDLK